MGLTEDQAKALDGITEFLRAPISGASPTTSDVAATLVGSAGTGKTYLTRELMKVARRMQMKVAGVAPTHKARKVLDRVLNPSQRSGGGVSNGWGSFITTKTMTVASLLNQMRVHSYVGTRNYRGDGNTKVAAFDFFLIDETSMISDPQIDLILKYAKIFRKKLLFIGDDAQIPNPVQKMVRNQDRTISKKDCKTFKFDKVFRLTTIVRQAKENPITRVHQAIRQDLNQEPVIDRTSQLDILDPSNGSSDGSPTTVLTGVEFLSDGAQFYGQIQDHFRELPVGDRPNSRILAYTNDSVRHYNQVVRKSMGLLPKFTIGELLMGYENIGFPDRIIENGQDYLVTHIRETFGHQVHLPQQTFKELIGHLVTIREIDPDVDAAGCETDANVSSDERLLGGREDQVFFPALHEEENQFILNELVRRAERVNRPHSSKQDFKRYSQLKSKLFFLESVYKYRDQIMDETEFRLNHPLLFTYVLDLITEDVYQPEQQTITSDLDGGNAHTHQKSGLQSQVTRTINKNKLFKEIEHAYPGLVQKRLRDDKSLSASELLADQFQILEKDLDYGYAITTHKAQGSTYRVVFIDESDFEKIRDHWNYRHSAMERRLKEKNQLKYVAYTRPSQRAIAYYVD